MSPLADPTSSNLPTAAPVEGAPARPTEPLKDARNPAEATASSAIPSSSSSSSSRRRSSASSSVPGAEQMPAPNAANINASGISAMVARIMVAARYLLSGNFDIAGTINDMGQVEHCIGKLARRMDRCATAVNDVTTGVVNFVQTLPTLAEAVVRVTTTFAGAFPFIGRMFR